MHNLIDFILVKHTGKSGYPVDVNCVGFKSIDTATNDENSDVRNYPVYAPYLKDRSFSYENWMKIKVKLLEGDYILSSRGITIKETCGDACYNRTYTKIKNICIWFNCHVNNSSIIRVGQNKTYIRPVDDLSTIAVEDIETYTVDKKHLVNTVKIPLMFNGKNELFFTEINGNINDDYLVFQLEVLKGLVYQLDYKPLKINLHYELE